MEGAAVLPGMAAEHGFSAETIRRLCSGLILAEQAEMVARGLMGRDALVPLQNPHLSVAEKDALKIDEDGLGFDSLARLALILRVNRFFNLGETGVEDYLLVHRTLGDWVALVGEHLKMVGQRAQFTFDTSGSAGPVKHISHRVSDLLAEVSAQRAGPLAHLPKNARIMSLVPPHHIYGFLFTCLLPMVSRGEVLDLHQSGPLAVFRHARPGDLIVGTPFNWQILLSAGLPLPRGVFGVTSAGPTTRATWEVRQINKLAGLTEIYGATETGGIGWREDFDEPFRLLPHLVRQGDLILDPAHGPVPLAVQDRLEWTEDDRFHLLGRTDDVVQVAGMNVSPTQVRKTLCAIEGVADAAVRHSGDRMKAFIAPTPGLADIAAFERGVRDQIARTLPAHARPTSLTFGPALPRNAMGKLCDWNADPGGG